MHWSLRRSLRFSCDLGKTKTKSESKLILPDIMALHDELMSDWHITDSEIEKMVKKVFFRNKKTEKLKIIY